MAATFSKRKLHLNTMTILSRYTHYVNLQSPQLSSDLKGTVLLSKFDRMNKLGFANLNPLSLGSFCQEHTRPHPSGPPVYSPLLFNLSG